MSEDVSIESRKRLQVLLADIKAFQKTSVHTFFVGQARRSLDAINERILDDEPTSVNDIIELLNRRGERRNILADITFFEDSVTNLEGRIEELLDIENQTSQKQEPDDEIQ